MTCPFADPAKLFENTPDEKKDDVKKIIKNMMDRSTG